MSVPDAIAPLVGYRTWAPGLGQLWSAHGPGRERWPRTEPLRAIALGTASPASSIPTYQSTPGRINAAPAASMRSSLRGIWSSTSRAIRGPSLPDESRNGGASPSERRIQGRACATPSAVRRAVVGRGHPACRSICRTRLRGSTCLVGGVADTECTARLSGIPPSMPGGAHSPDPARSAVARAPRRAARWQSCLARFKCLVALGARDSADMRTPSRRFYGSLVTRLASYPPQGCP